MFTIQLLLLLFFFLQKFTLKRNVSIKWTPSNVQYIYDCLSFPDCLPLIDNAVSSDMYGMCCAMFEDHWDDFAPDFH